MNKDEILHEASRQAIKALVDVMSTSLTTSGKKVRMQRIADDLITAINAEE